jgi:hypothetical protein
LQLSWGEVFSSAAAIFCLLYGDDLSFAFSPGAAKLDVIGGIVNMSRTYPALRLRRYRADATM